MAVEYQSNGALFFRTKHIHADVSDKIFKNFEDIFEHLHPDVQCWTLHFENEVHSKDLKYAAHKIKQLRKQKYKKILNGCVKILRSDESNIWAYTIAGATCRKYEKHVHDGLFYFSQAALLNPNSLTAWVGLSKYIKDNPYVENIIFTTVFSALLYIEKRPEKQCEIVNEIISLGNIHRPLNILSPYVFSSENPNNLLILQLISQCVFDQLSQESEISCIDLGIRILEFYYNNYPDESLMMKLVSFMVFNGFYSYFSRFCASFCCNVNLEELDCSNTIFKRLIILLSLSLNLSANILIQKLSEIFPEKIPIKRKCHLRYLSCINISYADFRRARDHYMKVKIKVLQLDIRDKIIGIQSYIKLGCNELAWKELLLSNHSWRNKLLRFPLYKSRLVYDAYRDLSLNLMTRGSTKSIRKMGALFCLKLLNDNTSVSILYRTCIGCIGCDEIDIAIKLIPRLLRHGAINEVLFLKYLLEENSSSKLVIFKEISEFFVSYETSSAASYFSEKESKVFKNICKASVMVPHNSVLYEWLGIYFYERGNFEKAEKYFEIALFYDPSSWISINYYSMLLAKNDPDSSKLFLDLYRHSPMLNYSCSHLISFKAGLFFLKYHSQKYDFYKACENLRFGMCCTSKNRHFREMLGEAYSLYGMVGVGVKWLSDCFIVDNIRNLYAGSQLGKLYLFTSGVEKYTRMMRRIMNKGGLNTFISLHNSAHSFLLKAIIAFNKRRHHISHVYSQKGLIMCVRAIAISTNYPATWKILGDFFSLCGHFNHLSGFLYVPHWLLPGCTSKKIILIRRFQALQLSIRCYYAALSLQTCSVEMKSSLWNSIALSYKQMTKFCKISQKQQILRTGVCCSIESLNGNLKNSLSWNTLGILLKNVSAHDVKGIHPHACQAFVNCENLSDIVWYRLLGASNLGFLHLWAGEFDKAFAIFLSGRGQSTSLDYPWIGQIFLSLIKQDDIINTLNHVLFLYKLTHHFPTIKVLFTFLLLLCHYVKKIHVTKICEKFSKSCGGEIFNFKELLLSSCINMEKNLPNLAKMDLIFALRTCNELKSSEIEDFYSALFEIGLFHSKCGTDSLLMSKKSKRLNKDRLSINTYKRESPA